MSHEVKTRFLKISKNKIYLSNNNFIDIINTNFPKGSISFKQHLDTYLKVEISNYDKILKSLEVKIVDYSPIDIHPFNEQKLKKPIHALIFKELKWSKLKSLLSHYKVNLPNLIPQAFTEEYKTPKLYKDLRISDDLGMENDVILSNNNLREIQLNTKEVLYEVYIEILFTELNFHRGYVSTIRTFNFYQGQIELKLYNNLFHPEYNYIKKYFANYFKKQSLNALVKIKTKGTEILTIECQCKVIENIDNNVIDNINTQRTLDLSKIREPNETEKSIYNADEIFSKLDNAENIFDQGEIDILSLIIENKSPRNVRQLAYLAGERHNVSEKIRFTLNPLFGFVFFINGKIRNHICWELLDSHATYLWSYDKSISIGSQVKFAEKNINTINLIGRMKYRSLIKNKEIKIESTFNVINHSKSKKGDDFEIWKIKLLDKLI